MRERCSILEFNLDSNFIQKINVYIRLRNNQNSYQFSSVHFSRWVVSDFLWPHESQHTRPPCPSPTPGVHSDSRPSGPWCYPAISSSVVLFPSCLQSLPASGSFPMSQLFTWGGQSTGVSAWASFLPKKSKGWFPPYDSRNVLFWNLPCCLLHIGILTLSFTP